MARFPKGTIIQPVPSFWIRNMAGAASSTGPLALGNLGAVGLINDSADGEWLVVWDVQVVAIPNPPAATLTVVDMAICQGRNAGSLLIANNSNPNISGGNKKPGTTWTLNVPGNELGAIFNSVSLIASGNTYFYQWLHEWPLCAIQPGDSFVCYSDANAYSDFGMNCLYEVVPRSI